jgi:antitoxin component YwqK of YwqJK toxin-antitoxin module
MKKIISLIALLPFICLSQKDNVKSIYKNLPVKKFYNVVLETVNENGKEVYKADGKVVDKTAYDKFTEGRKAMETCKPCILETYDANEKLVNKAVKYLDCPVGYWYNYFPSGKIKTIGHYRENESDVWDPLWNAGYCVKHGTWTEYNEKGKVTSFELYEFGNLKENKKKK